MYITVYKYGSFNYFKAIFMIPPKKIIIKQFFPNYSNQQVTFMYACDQLLSKGKLPCHYKGGSCIYSNKKRKQGRLRMLVITEKIMALLPYTFNACSNVAVADVFDLYRMVSWQNMVAFSHFTVHCSLLTHATTWLNIWSVCHFLTLPPFLYCYYCLNNTNSTQTTFAQSLELGGSR